MNVFGSTARAALAGPLSTQARLLVLDTAAAQGNTYLVRRTLESADPMASPEAAVFWGHPAAALAFLEDPSLAEAPGLAQSHVSAAVALTRNLLAYLDDTSTRGATEDFSYDPAASPERALASLTQLALRFSSELDYTTDEGELDPASPDAMEVRAYLTYAAEELCRLDRLLQTYPYVKSIEALTKLLPDADTWLRGVLPQLDPAQRHDANLLVRLCSLEVTDTRVWESLRWATLNAGERESASYAARLLEFAAGGLEGTAAREAFATLSDSWVGTAGELVSTCNDL